MKQRSKRNEKRQRGPREPFEARPSGWLAWWIALAALVRLPMLGRFGLWLDEIYVRDHVLATIPENLAAAPQHFAHFLVLKPSLAIQDSEFFLRLPSAIFGILAVPLGYFTARRLFGERAGLLLAFFIAVGTYFIGYSFDANYYSHMMFWSLASLYCVARLVTTRRLRELIPLLFIAPFCFYVHPFSALFFVALAIALFVHLVVRGECFADLKRFRSSFETAPKRLLTLTSIVAGLAFVLWMFGNLSALGSAGYLLNRFLEMLSLGESPSSIELSRDFFAMYLRRIGPGFFWLPAAGPAEQAWIAAGSILILALALLGAAASARREATLPLFILLPFAVSFGIIFNLDARRYFHIRYFSYLVPLYWMAASVGVDTALGAMARLFKGLQPSRARRWATVAAAAFVLSFSTTHLWYYFTTDGRNWDTVMAELARRGVRDEPVIYTNWAEEDILPYYVEKYRLDDLVARKLRYSANRSDYLEYELKDAAYRLPRLWFLSSWRVMQSVEAIDWAKRNMRRAAAGHSVFRSDMSTWLYRWDMGGRFVLAPRILKYEPVGVKAGLSAAFEEEFLFDRAMDYEFRFQFEGDPPAGLKATAGATPLDWRPLTLAGGVKVAAARAGIPAGRATIALDGGPEAFRLLAIEIIPRYEDNVIRIPAWEAADIHPSEFTWTMGRGGDRVLVQKRNTFSMYRFSVAEGGNYWIGVEARHDRPAPVNLELRLDDRALGVLAYEKNDDSWETLGTPVRLTPGDHRVTIRFVNEGDVTGGLAAHEDRDAFLREVVVAYHGDQTPPASDFAFQPTRPPEPLDFDLLEDGSVSEDWQIEVSDAAAYNPEVLVDAATDQRHFSAVIPAGSNGLNLLGPSIRLGPSRLVYYSGVVRAQYLNNHSINLLTRFLDEYGRPLRNDEGLLVQTEVNKEGITGSTGWLRIVACGIAPEGAAGYQPSFIVYPNGTRTSDEPGRVYFMGMQVEAN